MKKLFLGVDIGSATVKVIGIDEGGTLVGDGIYLRHDLYDTPLLALKAGLKKYLDLVLDYQIAGVGTTGSGRELYSKIMGSKVSKSEIFAHSYGLIHLLKQGLVTDSKGNVVRSVGTIIEIGGQDSKVIIFDKSGLPIYFNMNTICSAGTGEFLKQIADDAELNIKDFAANALKSDSPARIDSTCTVFSKRDFRHLTQKGVPLSDRLAGIAIAMVNNYLINVVKNQELKTPIFFQGGVAYNQAVLHAFSTMLKEEVLIPPMHEMMGAIGMAVITKDEVLPQETNAAKFPDNFLQEEFATQVRYCHGCANACELTQPFQINGREKVILDTIGGRCEGSLNPKNVQEVPQDINRITFNFKSYKIDSNISYQYIDRGKKPIRSSVGQYFAGIDGGSRGTKYALIYSNGTTIDIVTVGTINTKGDAIYAIKEALRGIYQALPSTKTISGIGTTGSAGETARDMLTTKNSDTADVKSTEILAHLTWAKYLVPNVGTIFDIGGNDAKIIAVLPHGIEFAMNDKCAAGSGSFIEAVARRFHVPLEKFGEIALSANKPTNIAGRCAVFGESDIIHKARSGFPTNELFLGLAYSITHTYLTDIGKGIPINLPIVAQGGGFLNSALVHAFKTTLGLNDENFIIANDPKQVLGAGALGTAILAKKAFEDGYNTHFKGFETVLNNQYQTITTTCRHPNCFRTCDGVVALLENELPIAGYKAVDCELGVFDGMITSENEQQRVLQLIQEGNYAV